MKRFSDTTGAKVEPGKSESADKALLIGQPFTVISYTDTTSEQYGDNTKITILVVSDEYLVGFGPEGDPSYRSTVMYGGRRLNEQLRAMNKKFDFPFKATLRKNQWGAYEFCDPDAEDANSANPL